MSAVSTEQENKFGTTCKWLDFDNDCHLTKCVINWARREVLFEAFQNLEFKHPEFAYEIFSENCYKMHGDYKCFNSEQKPEQLFDDETEECRVIRRENNFEECLTNLEKEALETAREELKDESMVKDLYLKGKTSYIEKERKRLEDEMTRLKEIGCENEV